MCHSSKVSACRRERNSHNAAEPRATSQSKLRARLQAPVESAREGQARSPRPFTNGLQCIGSQCRFGASGQDQARGAVAAMVFSRRVGLLKLLQESVSRSGPQRAAAGVWRRSPGGTKFFASLAASAHRAQRCLTPRSSRAPPACHAGPAGGTQYICAIRARASHRWCRLNSNVRPHTNHFCGIPQRTNT